MRKTILILFLMSVISAKSQKTFDLPVWPNGAPESNELAAEEKVTPEGHVQNSKEAILHVFLPEKTINTGKTVLICPGGGYSVLAMMHEGYDVAKWLNSKGIAAIVLKYRMPNHHSNIPLSDAKQAMSIIRAHAAEWEIDSTKIGVCGFSAGGHLASTLLTKADNATRPNFGILFYPVVSMKNGITHGGSRNQLLVNPTDSTQINMYSGELHVSATTPPTLFILADDDKAVIPENSVLLYQAFKKNKVAASMHIFPSGGHGFGFRASYKYHNDILLLISDWIGRF